jgi:hypothetical protein
MRFPYFEALAIRPVSLAAAKCRQDNGQARGTDFGHALARITPFGQKANPGRAIDRIRPRMSELFQQAQWYRFAGDLFHLIEATFAESAHGLEGRKPLRAAVEASDSIGCKRLVKYASGAIRKIQAHVDDSNQGSIRATSRPIIVSRLWARP